MSKNLSKKEIDKFSRQIILKNIGPLGQKKILDSKVLIIGMGGLGCPAADFLINNKDRIAQMILTPVIKMEFEETDDLPETVRGEGGFGSTGK